MKKLAKISTIRQLAKDSKGATMVEYALMLFLILVVAAAAVEDARKQGQHGRRVRIHRVRQLVSSSLGPRPNDLAWGDAPGEKRAVEGSTLPGSFPFKVGEVLWFLGAAVVVALAAAWFDSRTGHIPNWLTYGALAVGPFAHLFYTLAHTGRRLEALQELGYGALGAFVCAILPVALFRANALGGGDVKLFVALGALLQPLLGLEAELWSFCAAALIAPVRLAWDGKLFQTVANAAYLAINPFLPKERQRLLDRENVSWFRMGPAVLTGVAFTLYLHRHEVTRKTVPGYRRRRS